MLRCNFPHFVFSRMSLSHFKVALYAVCFVESVVQNAFAPSLPLDPIDEDYIPSHLLLRDCTFTSRPSFQVASGEGILETNDLLDEV